jgi:hypothetical protein
MFADSLPFVYPYDTLAYYAGFNFGLYHAKSVLAGEQKLLFFFFGFLFALGIDFCFFVWRCLKCLKIK